MNPPHTVSITTRMNLVLAKRPYSRQKRISMLHTQFLKLCPQMLNTLPLQASNHTRRIGYPINMPIRNRDMGR
jgi:hypothetical protein